MTKRLNVSFDSEQIVIECNSLDVADRLSLVFEHALVPEATKCVATLTIEEMEGRYLVRSTAGDVVVSDNPTMTVRHAKTLVHRLFMNSRRDLLWLHAAALDCGEGVLLISGMAGEGKSTIAIQLVESGWRLLSDDISPVQLETLEVLPYYELPVRRPRQPSVLPFDEVRNFVLEDVSLSSHQIERRARPLKMVAFPTFEPSCNTFVTKMDAPTTALKLLQNAANFGGSYEKDQLVRSTSIEVFKRAAGLASGIPAYSLTYSDSLAASKVIEGLYSCTDV